MLGIVVGVSVGEGNYGVELVFMGRVGVKYVGVFMVGVDLVLMSCENGGGEIGDVGGGVGGWWFGGGLERGDDGRKWIKVVWEWFGGLGGGVKGKGKMKVE